MPLAQVNLFFLWFLFCFVLKMAQTNRAEEKCKESSFLHKNTDKMGKENNWIFICVYWAGGDCIYKDKPSIYIVMVRFQQKHLSKDLAANQEFPYGQIWGEACRFSSCSHFIQEPKRWRQVCWSPVLTLTFLFGLMNLRSKYLISFHISKLIKLGIICYTAIDNQYNYLQLQSFMNTND